MRCVLAILVALILVGCDPIASQRVTLSVSPITRPPQTQATAQVRVGTPQIDAAIQIVDGVVRKRGLAEGEAYPGAGADMIHWWGLTIEEAQKQHRGSLTCTAYFRDGELQVLFAEFGRWTSSSAVKDMAGEIRSAFVARFGSERVK
jgi:hypothetical protein